MSLYEIRDRNEFTRILKAYRLVLLQYLDPSRDKESRELYYAFRKLSEIVSGNRDVIAAIIRIDKYPELASDISKTPLLRVYYDGKVIFEQYGGFSERELDLYVIRRGIRSVLYKMNLNYRI